MESESQHTKPSKRLKLSLVACFLLALLALFLPINKGDSISSDLVEKLSQNNSAYKKLESDLTKLNGTVLLQATQLNQLPEDGGSQVTNLTTVNNLQSLNSTTNITQNSDTLNLLTCGVNQVAKWSGSAWACADDTSGGTGTDEQQLSLSLNQLSIQNGNSVDLSIYLDNTDLLSTLACTDEQIVRFDGTNWNCSQDINTDTDTDQQALSWDSGSRTLNLTNGGSVIISDENNTYSSGVGLSLIGSQFNLNPSNLGAISSVTNSDEIIIGTSSGPQKITYNDLFGNILGALNYRGTWNASTNSPDLSSYCDNDTKGHYYVVSDAGNTNLGGFTGWQNNDWVICDGTGWQKIESTNQVNSVFGRSGTVTAQNGDYNAGQITVTPAGTITSTNVQSALEELATELALNIISAGNGLSLSGGVMSINAPTCTNTQKLTWNGSSFLCTEDKDTLSGLTCGTNSTPWWDSVLLTWQCSQISTGNIATGGVNSSDILNGTILFADLSANGCTSGQIMKFNGTAWACTADDNAGTTYSAGTGINIDGSNVISSTLGTDITSSEIVDGTISTADIGVGAITSDLVADGTITFTDWASSGCTADQIPRYGGTVWSCAPYSGGSVGRSAPLASAQSGTQVILGELEFRYNSNATAGNLELRSSTGSTVPLRALPFERYGTSELYYGLSSITANANSGAFQTISASGASSNELIFYDIFTATNHYEVKISNFNNSNINLVVKSAM